MTLSEVLVRCVMCGDLSLRPDQVLLVVWRGSSSRTSYRFDCPDCGETWNHAASADAVTALRRVQAPERVVHVPAEAEERHDGPPLTKDDLLDLMLDLQSLDRAPELLGSRGPALPHFPTQRRPSALESLGRRCLRALARVFG